MALKNFIGEEEKFSLGEFAGRNETSVSSMFPVINSYKNEAKSIFNSNQQASLTNNYDLTTIAEELKVLENSAQESNIERRNVFITIKNRINDLKTALTKENLSVLPLRDKGLLQNIYEELKTIKSEILDHPVIVKKNEVEPLTHRNKINEKIDRVSNNVKAAIDNSIEKLANIISPQNMGDGEISERIQQRNTNLLPLIEAFNKEFGQAFVNAR